MRRETGVEDYSNVLTNPDWSKTRNWNLRSFFSKFTFRCDIQATKKSSWIRVPQWRRACVGIKRSRKKWGDRPNVVALSTNWGFLLASFPSFSLLFPLFFSYFPNPYYACYSRSLLFHCAAKNTESLVSSVSLTRAVSPRLAYRTKTSKSDGEDSILLHRDIHIRRD